jgi:hypothetical protein
LKATHILIAASLLATSGGAAAQSATDARCILLSNAFGQQAKDPNAQKLAEATLYFYLGRVGAQATTAQFKALLDAQAKTITDATAGGLMGDCVKAVQAKIQLLQSVAAQSQPAPAQPPKKP